MNHNCDNCGRLGDMVQITIIRSPRGWKFWKKYNVIRKFCTFGCLFEYCQKDKAGFSTVPGDTGQTIEAEIEKPQITVERVGCGLSGK